MTENTDDEYTHEDVPDIIGFGQDSTQMENVIRRGYAAFVRDEDPHWNPYIHKSYENFSGFKKRKKKLWDGGWKLAAVREGDYDSIEAVCDDYGGLHRWTPQSPEAGLYAMGASKPTPAGGLTSEYVYTTKRREFFETRHEAVGAACVAAHTSMPRMRESAEEKRRKRLKKMTDVRVYERERPPLITEEHKDGE